MHVRDGEGRSKGPEEDERSIAKSPEEAVRKSPAQSVYQKGGVPVRCIHDGHICWNVSETGAAEQRLRFRPGQHSHRYARASPGLDQLRWPMTADTTLGRKAVGNQQDSRAVLSRHHPVLAGLSRTKSTQRSVIGSHALGT
jgi:hypothetical protein